MANSPTSLFPLGSGQGVDERQLGQNSALRNGFLYGKTNAGTFNAVVTDAAGGALAIATDWTDMTVNRQRMPCAMTPCITLVSPGLAVTEKIQFRFWGENLFGEQLFEESPALTFTSTALLTTALVFMSKPFAVITRIQYKLTGLQWSFLSVGAVGLWDRETVDTTFTGYIAIVGRSHIGIELPVKVEMPQSASLYAQPQVLSFRTSNHTDPAGFDQDNLAELQPTTDEAGSLGGFVVGDKLLNTETVTGWSGYPNKVRIVRVPGTKTVRADSGVTTFRYHTAAPTLAFDNIQYFLEARTSLGTARTFAVPA